MVAATAGSVVGILIVAGLGEGGSVPRYAMLASKGMNDGHRQGLIHGQLLPSPHLLWTL